MTYRWRRPTPLAYAFLVLALAGVVVTWTYNITAITSGRDYLGDWFGSGPSVSSLTADVLIAAIASVVFILVEGRRLGIRFAWIFVVLIPLVALAFALPLFLGVREMRVRAEASPA